MHGEELSYLDLLQRCEEEQSRAIREVSCFLKITPEIQFQSLQGGLTRAKLYSFEMEGKKYVLRFLALGPTQPEEIRQNEVWALKIGNTLGIAPRCIFSDSRAVAMVMPFIEGHALHHPDNEELIMLGKMLRSLHDYKGDYPKRYTFQERLGRHYQKAINTGVVFPSGFDQEIQAVLTRPQERAYVPSHGDLNPSNILIGDQTIHLIDWTNATWDDPFADLSYFSQLAHLSPSQEAVFLEAYFGRTPSEKDWEVLKEEKANVYLLTATIWFRFSETEEDKMLSTESRMARLDAELRSPLLKKAQDYLQEGIVVDLNTASKAEIRSYALSFYKAYLIETGRKG